MFLPATRNFRQAPAQNGRSVEAACCPACAGGMVVSMAGALSRLLAWFSQTVNLPLLPGLLPPEAGRVFSSAFPVRVERRKHTGGFPAPTLH